MHKSFIRIAAILGAITVITGAFGAHTLRKILSPNILTTYETAVRYQFFHVLALLITGILFKEFTNNSLRWAGYFFIAGIILFSGSLYLITYLQTTEIVGYKGIGILTPLGGLLFIVAWLLLAIGIKSKQI